MNTPKRPLKTFQIAMTKANGDGVYRGEIEAHTNLDALAKAYSLLKDRHEDPEEYDVEIKLLPVPPMAQRHAIAIAYLAKLLEDAMENGEMPQPSHFGVPGDNPDTDPVYEWCTAFLNDMVETLSKRAA